MKRETAAIIPRLRPAGHTPEWQRQLATAIHSIDELYAELGLATRRMADDAGFALRVPRAFVRRMRKGDPRDPLLLQVLPDAAENAVVDGYGADPLQESGSMPVPGLLHKYHGRALLTLTGACAVHCRYCFRRHFPYADANPSVNHWQAAIDYLARHRDICELILSGGDPLTLADERLAAFTHRLYGIDHLHTLRIHTRLPVVLPARIDAGLLDWLAQLHLRVVIVIHCNHPDEIDDEVQGALQRLGKAGITLLNQSVLLHGINDYADTLARLSERLFDAGVLPYYLHQLDRVQGAAHFAVDDGTACRLQDELRGRLPGYLVPRLVREIPGERGKMPVSDGLTV